VRPILALGAALGVLACRESPPPAYAAAQDMAPTAAIADAPPESAATQSERVAASDSLAQSRRSAITVAAARVAPAVVSVNVTRRQQLPRNTWDWFFMPRGSERVVQGLGSGFIVSPDGIVITNQHVTEGAEEIVVTTRDGTDFPATLLGEDPLTDIAVLKIDGANLPTASLGRSSDLMIGEWVVAIGNPYGYLLGNTEPSVTAGVVSAVGRNLIPSGNDQTIYVGMIQTDAAINPGNSGGPLVNALGEVVGVNSSIFSGTGESVGIGFAIPVERALRVAGELQRFGSVKRSWVGVTVPGSEQMREWKQSGGLPVTDVAGDGPAATGGVRTGDVIVSADGKPVRTFLDWEAVQLDVSPGDTLPVVVRRDGRERRLRVVVGDLPTTSAERVSVLGDMDLITVTPPVRQERRIQSERGALIYRIGDRTAGATGLRAGDVIFQINRQRITQAEEVREAFREAAGRSALRVYVERGGYVSWTEFYVR
jgi:serine protease Do